MDHVHLIGIGGTGLSAIALVLLEKGYRVSGSDRQFSQQLGRLQAAGARIFVGHAAENILGADLVVRSSAIGEDNPEIQAAQARGIPVLKRENFLEFLIADQKTIAVAGTHGKTTTTAMVAWLLTSLELDPSFVIGSIAWNLGANAHAGQGAYFVIEADEYDYMFLGLNPYIAVISNIEHDHPDFFPSYEDFYHAFQSFASRLIDDGILVVCADDPGARQLGEELSKNCQVLTYSLTDPQCDYFVQDMRLNQFGGYDFQIYRNPAFSGAFPVSSHNVRANFTTRVMGLHNVQNALAALIVADLVGLNWQDCAAPLSGYRGAARRFEELGTCSGVTIVSDYAHHPTEIRATLAAARARFPGRDIWVVWQPHTYSRTRALAEQFTMAFRDRETSLADHVIVTEIYAAREASPPDGFSAVEVANRIQNPDVHFIPRLDEVSLYLLNHLTGGEVLLVLSAGDADQVCHAVCQGLTGRHAVETADEKTDTQGVK
jgi:UDP-N-acetylmuramate--alanine ligase